MASVLGRLGVGFTVEEPPELEPEVRTIADRCAARWVRSPVSAADDGGQLPQA